MGYDDISGSVPMRRTIPHYHGDTVRALLVVAAIFILVSVFMLGVSPLKGAAAIIVAILLVIAAGITNPAQVWIHWADAILAGLGTLYFGSSALGSYREGIGANPIAFIYMLALAIVSLVALYFATRTIRGMVIGEP